MSKANLVDRFAQDWQFSEKYLPLVREILLANARYFVRIEMATREEDVCRSTDLRVAIDGGAVAVRVRRGDTQYRDLTIRAFLANGARTEIDKLRDGFVDWYLYAWAGEDGQFADWILVDVKQMRRSGLLDTPRQLIMNPDGRTGFYVYTLQELIESGSLVNRKAGLRSDKQHVTVRTIQQ